MTRRARRQHVVAGIVCLVFAVGFTVLSLMQENGDVGSRWTLVIVGLIFAAYTLHILLAPAKVRVILHGDAMEIETAYRKRRVSRADVSGYRLHPGQGRAPVIRVMTRVEPQGLLLPDFLELDSRFHDWFEGVASIDEQEQQASWKALLESPALAGSSEEKLAVLRRARRIANWLNWISLGVFFWLAIYPRPYWWVMGLAALLPLIAIWLAATQGALYKLDRHDNDVAANVLGLMYMPGLGLALRATMDVNTRDHVDLFWLTGAGVALLMFLVWWFVEELRGRALSLAAIAALMAPHVYGSISMANVRFDSSTPVVLERGGGICIREWSGALGVRRFEVSECGRK